MVGSMLRAWGVDVAVATSVEELEALASAPPNTVSFSSGGEESGVSSGRGESGLSSMGPPGVSSNGRLPPRLDRMEIDRERAFDMFVVDSPVAGRVFDTQKLEALLGESREAIELMHRACALGRGVPTVLLTSKNTRNVFQSSAEAMVRRERLLVMLDGSNLNTCGRVWSRLWTPACLDCKHQSVSSAHCVIALPSTNRHQFEVPFCIVLLLLRGVGRVVGRVVVTSSRRAILRSSDFACF